MKIKETTKCKHGCEFAYYSFPQMFKLCKCCGIAEMYGFEITSNGYCIHCDETIN